MKSKIFMLSLLVLTALAGTGAHAHPVCDTLAQCRALQVQVQARIQDLLRSETLSLGDLVRNADGSVRRMSQNEANQYCRDQGSRLPTTRELALYSQSLGSRGILETAYVGVARTNAAVRAESARMLNYDYRPILTQNDDHQEVVDFYFSHIDYRRPAGDQGYFWIWSSTPHPSYSEAAYYILGANTGYFYGDVAHVNSIAVRCVKPSH